MRRCAAVPRSESVEGRKKPPGARSPKGRIAAGFGVVIGLDRHRGLLPRLQRYEITR